MRSVGDNAELNPADPCYHTHNIRRLLKELSDHCREDVGKIDEPRAQALLETTAEVVDGLAKAYEHYEAKAEPAWGGEPE